VKRSHGSGDLYVKHGSYYGRWRGVDGRLINKKIGKVRTRGEKDGISAAAALAVLDVIEDERVLDRVQRTGYALREALTQVAADIRWSVTCEASVWPVASSSSPTPRRVNPTVRSRDGSATTCVNTASSWGRPPDVATS
jgi:hypothetical protein